MAISAGFQTLLGHWLALDASVSDAGHLGDSETIDIYAQHYLDGAAALSVCAQSVEDQLVLFQWRGHGRLLEALSSLERASGAAG